MLRVADLFCGGGGENTGIMQADTAAGLRVNFDAADLYQIDRKVLEQKVREEAKASAKAKKTA